MATKTRIILIDDFDGGDADETIAFALDGCAYEIDLSARHADKFRGDLRRFTDAARAVKAPKSGRALPAAPKSGRRRAERGATTRAIRAWAAAQGIALKPRGRIPADVEARYNDTAAG